MAETTLKFPGLTLDFHRPLPEDVTLLLLGGRAPDRAWLQELSEQPAASPRSLAVWAVDRGVEACQRANLSPELLLGDADSAAPASWAWGEAQAKATERHPVAKDLTDTQLALLRAEQKDTVLILTGAFGGRFDHAFSTIFSAAHDPHTCVLADEREALCFVHGGEKLTVSLDKPPKAISLLPITEKVAGVNLTGTAWPLSEAELLQSLPYAVSNALAEGASAFTVSAQAGILGLELVLVE